MPPLSPSQRAKVKLEAELSKFNDALQKYITASKRDAVIVVKQETLKIEAGVKERTPVDTGRLRNSIHHVFFGEGGRFSYSARKKGGRGSVTYDGTLSSLPTRETEALIGTNVTYALPIEAGHSSKAPAGMFRVTLEGRREVLKAAVKAALSGKGKGS